MYIQINSENRIVGVCETDTLVNGFQCELPEDFDFLNISNYIFENGKIVFSEDQSRIEAQKEYEKRLEEEKAKSEKLDRLINDGVLPSEIWEALAEAYKEGVESV